MPAQVLSTTENNFTKGLLTEFTGLNFPENAATDADNVIFTLVGDVVRREGFDYEANAVLQSINTTGTAVNTYKWNNAGGDGETQLIVQQAGGTLHFYVSSSATIAAPLSAQILSTASSVNVSSFVASGATFDPTLECQFTDGNGYLFVYHPNCDPFYVSYSSGATTAAVIVVQIRDFTGAYEPEFALNTRPSFLNSTHTYNLSNQGWTQGNPWAAAANDSVIVNTGLQNFTVAASIPGVTPGTGVAVYNNTPISPGGGPVIPAGTLLMSGNVQSYSGTSLIINVTSVYGPMTGNATSGPLGIVPSNVGFVNTWFADIGNYPSNSDVWWYFKDNTGVFNPTTTISNVNYNLGQAPQGHYILPAFTQDRALISSIPGVALNTIITDKRPTNGAWFQGRVWFTGVNAYQPGGGTSTADNYTWTENIYFSQIATTPADFGSCYQVNDPTSQDLNGLLPTDGGVITVQGSGAIYKLFPIANGILVFAANGVWFITGSQGIGFSANDYTITKISAIQSISTTSFVDVLGLPYFWNEEGIYMVTPTQGGSLTVTPITVGTIETLYDGIAIQNKQFARGAYHPIDYTIEWLYGAAPDNGNITNRYSFSKVLAYNTYNKAFYTYTISDGTPAVNGIIYVSSPGGSTAPDPVFKYPTSVGTSSTFSEENNTDYVDWFTFDNVGINYVSYFVTGYKLHGGAQKRFQMPYIYVYSRNVTANSYWIQGLWDYAVSGNTGRWSTRQQVNNFSPNFGMIIRRHSLRGRGLVLQIKIMSTDGMPFDIMGWSTYEVANAGV